MKYKKLYIAKKKAGTFIVKYRKKVRIVKAILGVSAFMYFKYHKGLDVDALFTLLGWWWLQEIKWR